MIAAFVFLVAGMAMMVLMQTDLNFLGFTMSTCVVSFVIGLVLFTAALYGKTGTAEDIRKEEDLPPRPASRGARTRPTTDRFEPAAGPGDRCLSGEGFEPQRALRVLRLGLGSRCDRPFQAMLTR